MAVSYGRNCNYKNQFEWIYESNDDLYKPYMKAKSDPKIEYKNRMKKLWDKIHPELTFFSVGNLQDQAFRIEKNRVVMERKCRIDKNQNNRSIVDNDSTEENSNVKSEHLKINNTLTVSDTQI